MSPRALAVALGGGNDPRRAALLAGRSNRYVQAVARELATIGPARPRLARTPVTPPPTGEPMPRTDPLAGTLVHEVVVSLVRRRVGFFTPLGTILGKVDTDLKPGTYTLRAEPDSKRWVVEGGTDARFVVTLEGADPWTLRYRDGTTTERHLDEIDESTPNLWAAKQEVAVIMDEYNATYIVESVFPSVCTILTLTPQPTGGAGRRPVFTRREFDREVVVEIGAGDLRASVRAAVERDAKVIAVDPEPPPAAAIAELESAGGTYLQGTAENLPAASADHVFQFFPHRSWGTGGTWHGGTWRLMETPRGSSDRGGAADS